MIEEEKKLVKDCKQTRAIDEESKAEVSALGDGDQMLVDDDSMEQDQLKPTISPAIGGHDGPDFYS